MFPTQFDKHDRVFAPSGDRFKTTFKAKFLDDGELVLEPAGLIDVYDEIQSHAASVDIHNILARFANGDQSALAAREVSFGDFTQMPKTYAQMLQAVTDASGYFQSLPVDIKVKFDNSPYKFFAQMGSDYFNSAMADYFKPASAASSVPVADSQQSKEGDA